MKYEFTGVTIIVCGKTLKRIRRLSDDFLVGWIEKEDNLSQDGVCFVYDNAQVYDNARVSGNALVSGNAQVYDNAKVYGSAEVTQCLHFQQPKHNITATDTHFFVGCEAHTHEYWFENIETIGAKHAYTKREIDLVRWLLKVAKQQILAMKGTT
jgi:YdcK Beta solenoid repeat